MDPHCLTIKITDFGESKAILNSVAAKSSVKATIGTIGWTAPEYLDVRRNNERTEKGDVYSFGVIIWELVTREIPWNEGLGPIDIIFLKVIAGEKLKIPSGCNKLLERMMCECWDNSKIFLSASID